MDRKSYMAELEKALKHLPGTEREEALRYYEEYFEDAGPEREAEVIEELGSAREAASQILKEVAIKRLDEPKHRARKGISTIWVVILALFAAPIGLPLLLVVLVLGLAVVILVCAIFLVLIITGAVVLAVSVVGILAGIFFLPTQIANGLAILGASLFLTGMGLLFLLAGIYCCRMILKALAGLVKKMLTGGKKHE